MNFLITLALSFCTTVSFSQKLTLQGHLLNTNGKTLSEVYVFDNNEWMFVCKTLTENTYAFDFSLDYPFVVVMTDADSKKMLYVEPSAPGLFELDANMGDSNNGKLMWDGDSYEIEKVPFKVKFKASNQNLAGLKQI
ncbi:MAG: hypothetical protein P8I31_03020 [Bacteroidia bacterium]|nr:hypothetical protein [Bacteroidia bacterium]